MTDQEIEIDVINIDDCGSGRYVKDDHSRFYYVKRIVLRRSGAGPMGSYDVLWVYHHDGSMEYINAHAVLSYVRKEPK